MVACSYRDENGIVCGVGLGGYGVLQKKGVFLQLRIWKWHPGRRQENLPENVRVGVGGVLPKLTEMRRARCPRWRQMSRCGAQSHGGLPLSLLFTQ